MTWFMVDIEADGPAPGLYSMVSLGAVIVEPGLERTFYGQFRPISEKWVPEALAVSGHSRKECMGFPDVKKEMARFGAWIMAASGTRKFRGHTVPDARFMSDNAGFDWQFVNYYFHGFYGVNPFGHSSDDLGSMYKGLAQTVFKSFKHLRKTKHTHHPVMDAKGNAEALLHMKDQMGMKIQW